MTHFRTALFASSLLFAHATGLFLAAPASAEGPAPALRVYPAAIELSTRRDRQSFVVQLTTPSGLTRDVTTEATVAIADVAVARLEGQTLHPLQDGSTTLTVSHAGETVTVPVVVTQATADPPLSFRADVMPVFMKTGCNMGSCHGAARGKDGFRLSLFGFDPEGDHFRLTREISGRRLNLAVPESSMMVEKSVGAVPHTGGKRFDVGDEYHATLVRWIAAGAPNDPDPAAVPKVAAVELYPPGGVLDGADATQRLTVRARYSDGSTRDVTHLAYFMTNNETSASISQEGVITAGSRGEAFVMARFDTHTVGSHFIVLPKGENFVAQSLPTGNYIDEHIHAKLGKLRMRPSDLCSDEEFLRRATLDVIGTLPTVAEYRQFMADTSPDKRERLIDELLGRKEFIELWVMKWAELLAIKSSNQVSYKAMLLYYNWLQERIAGNMPMDDLVRELLASKGGTFASPATNFYELERDNLKTAENVAQVFMGMRIQCAQCHNHPFDRWTMDDYYGFAAFFRQIGRKRGEDPREQIIFNSGGGEVKHPVDGRNMKPKFLGGIEPDLQGRDRREVLAEWLASPENPYFATNLANIVWSHFLGSGIIEQVDDVRVSNPASNPELLAELGKRFTEYDYDFKRLVRDICTSHAYQRSTRTNETNAADTRNFSKAELRRLRAEVLLDCIGQVTATQDKFQGLPRGARAVQIADGRTSTYFLTAFGRATRDTVCSCEVKVEPNLSQALHLLNGDTVNGKISQGNLVGTALKEGRSPREVMEEITIRCLTRTPTESEFAALDAALAEEGAKPDVILQDYFWAVLNTREFLFNH